MWKQYNHFSQEFLAQYQPSFLFDFFHRVKAFLLYPDNKDADTRSNIVLSLNLDYFHKIREDNTDPEFIADVRYLLRLPDESYLAQHYTKAYPTWLIEETLKQKEAENHFKIVSRLVWTLLRLTKTYREAGYPYSEASVKKALEVILGKTPLKSKAKELQRDEYLCGEKGYAHYFNLYKPLCHIVAAYEYLKEEREIASIFMDTSRIERFLSLAHWFREKLLFVQTPNVKGNTLFSEEILVPLPSWVKKQEINILIEPYEDKRKQLEEELRNAPTYTCTSEYRKNK